MGRNSKQLPNVTKKKLTHKQEQFSIHVASGKTLADSYRAAYSASNMSPAAIRLEACRLAANPAVTLAIEGMRAGKDQIQRISELSDKEKVLSKLRTMMDTAEPSDAVRIRATELLGKTVGLFRDVQEVIAQRSAAEIEADLIERLQQLTAQASTKDHPEHDKALN